MEENGISDATLTSLVVQEIPELEEVTRDLQHRQFTEGIMIIHKSL